jgi:hypothetical protein
VPPTRACRYARGVNDRDVITGRAAEAYRTLADLAESVEDEWQYVNDLVDAYSPAIEALALVQGGRAPTAAETEAVDEAIAEIGLVTDPHKAIDWLSTFPHVAALALGGDVDGPGGEGAAGESEADEPDEDSPFRMLGGLR